MALPISVNTFIDYGNISSFLAQNDFSGQNVLSGGAYNSDLPMRLSMVTRLVEWAYGKDSTDPSLTNTGNYLYQLCGKYIQQAKLIIANNMPGIIINPATGAESTLEYFWLQFVVGVTASPVNVNGVNVNLPNDGDTQIVIPLTYIANNSVNVIKSNTPLPIGLNDRESFSPLYTNNDVTITVNDSFQNGDLFVITGEQFVAI